MDKFYLCFAIDNDDGEVCSEAIYTLAETKEWDYYIEINVPTQPKTPAKKLGSFTLKV